jgi:hypothetical protein
MNTFSRVLKIVNFLGYGNAVHSGLPSAGEKKKKKAGQQKLTAKLGF